MLGKLEGYIREQITREGFPGPPQSSRHDKAEKKEEIRTSAHDSIQLGNCKEEVDKRSQSVGAPPQKAPVGLRDGAPGVLTPTLPASSEPGSRFFQAYANKGTFPGGSMGEELVHPTELSGEAGRKAAQSSLLIVVQSFFEQLPSRGPLVNAHFRFGAWTQTA